MYETFTNGTGRCQDLRVPAPPPLLLRARQALVDGALRPVRVLVEEGRITAVGEQLETPEGAKELHVDLLSPGLVDLHVHALDGAGTLEPPDVPGLSRALARRGVTGFLATAAAGPVEDLLPLLAPVDSPGARCLGVHLEGPWLSPSYPGAQPRDGLRSPSLPDLERLLAAGPPRMVTLAPELPEALDLVRRAADAGVVVSLGHSGATYEQALAALGAGARHVTHCFNAMAPLHHRDPGLVGAALDHPGASVEVIADGVHVHPAVVRTLWRACGPERLCLVSDAVDLALPGSDAARLADGTLAGSRIGLDTAVRNLAGWGVPLEDALQMASVTPASVLGLPHGLAPGNPADVVLLDDALQVVATVVGGEVVWQR